MQIYNNSAMNISLYVLSVLTQISVASYAPYLQIILRNKGYSYSLTGVIISLGQAAAIAGPLVVSALSDRKGRTRPFLFLSAALSLLSSIPLFFSTNKAYVILSVLVLDFFFWSLNPLSDAFINRSLRKERYKYGKIRAFGTLGYLTALILFAVSGFPDERNNASIFKCFLSVITIYILSLFLLKEERSEEKVKERKRFSLFDFNKGFYLFMFLVALTRVGQSVVEKMLSAYMTETLQLGSKFTLFISIGAFFEFFSLLLFSRLLREKKVRPLFMLFLSAVALTIRLLMYLIPNIYVFALAQTLHGLTFGACHSSATCYIAENVKAEHYEVGMSVYWALATNFPELLGTLVGGFVIESCGYNTLFLSYAVFPLIAALLAVILRKEIEP